MKIIINKIKDCRRCPNFDRDSMINGIGKDKTGYCKLENSLERTYFEVSEEDWDIYPKCPLENYDSDKKLKEYK